MGISDRHVDETAGIGLKPITVTGAIAASITAKAILNMVPGKRFIVERVEMFARLVGGGVKTLDVKIDGVTVISGAVPSFAADTHVEASLVAANLRKGGIASVLTVEPTTDATGAVTNAQVTVWIRFIDLPE